MIERHVFASLKDRGLLDGLSGGQFLEIGPKHGDDTRLLATLAPSEIMLVELPEKRDKVEAWLGSIPVRVEIRWANLLEIEPGSLGLFDLIWCTGVIYHNPEPLRLLAWLRKASGAGALLVLESEVVNGEAGRAGCYIELYYPDTYRGVPTITHLPTRPALEALLLLAGFDAVRELDDVYPGEYGERRAVFTARASGAAYSYYGYSVAFERNGI